jgi:hypothetical protein
MIKKFLLVTLLLSFITPVNANSSSLVLSNCKDKRGVIVINCKIFKYNLIRNSNNAKIELFRSDIENSKGLTYREKFVKNKKGSYQINNLVPGFYTAELKSDRNTFKFVKFTVLNKPSISVKRLDYAYGKIVLEINRFTNLNMPSNSSVEIFDSNDKPLSKVNFDISWDNYVFTVSESSSYKVIIKASNLAGETVFSKIIAGLSSNKVNYEDKLIDYSEAVKLNNGNIMLMSRAPENNFNFITDQALNTKGARSFYNCFANEAKLANNKANEVGYLGGAFAGRDSGTTSILTSAVLEFSNKFEFSNLSSSFNLCVNDAIYEQMGIISLQLSPTSIYKLDKNNITKLDKFNGNMYKASGNIKLSENSVDSKFEMLVLINPIAENVIGMYISVIEGKSFTDSYIDNFNPSELSK